MPGGEISGSFTAVCDGDGYAHLSLSATGIAFRPPAPPKAAGPAPDSGARGSTMALPAGQMYVPPTPQMCRPDALTLARAVIDGDIRAAACYCNMSVRVLRKRLTTQMYNIQVRMRYQVGCKGEWSPAAQAKLDHYLLDPPRTATTMLAIADGPAAEAPPPAIADGPAVEAPPPTAKATSDSTSSWSSSEDEDKRDAETSSTDDDEEKSNDDSEHEANDELICKAA